MEDRINMLSHAGLWSTINSMLAVAVPVFLFGAGNVHASPFDITIINATFTATCVGGGVCTEVVNGSFVGDFVTNSVSNISLQLTGTLSGLLDTYDPVREGFLDSGAISGFTPIFFGPALAASNPFDAPTPRPLQSGPLGTNLIVPALCGGDQPNCGSAGSFPVGSYNLTSGTYTSVAVTPEPGSLTLSVLGLLGVTFLAERELSHRPDNQGTKVRE